MRPKSSLCPRVLPIIVASALGCASTSPVAVSSRVPVSSPVPRSQEVNLAQASPDEESEASVPAAQGLESTEDLQFAALRGRLWLHTSWALVEPWGRVPANGLLVVGKSEALVIDTPWNDAQTQRVFDEVKRVFNVPITKVIVTHAHDDNLGGLGAAHRLGATSYASALTIEFARAAGKTVPQTGFDSELSLNAAGTAVELYYSGPGHTRDNIVVYLPELTTLFGGCLIKEGSAKSLGNTADADIAHWADSVAGVINRYPNATVVVPGHGSPGDWSLLAHTKALAEAAR